jgi:hypothetical protein
MRGPEHEARTGRSGMRIEYWWGHWKERDHHEDNSLAN